jgi:hypothetical protein
MNGEVQLIVRIPGTAPSGIVTATESGVLDVTVNPQVALSYPNDMSSYVGGYVQIQSAVYGDLGTYFIQSVALDNPAYAYISPTNTQLFSDAPFNFAIDNYDLPNFNYMEAVPSSTEYYLDLYENESISQNWKFQDLSNFSAQGAFSREFRIPFSETNKEALGALFDNNVEQGAENYFFYKLPAEIRVDTLPIAAGYLRVRKVYKQMNRLSEVEVAFYAETPDLVRTIGEKKLSDIAALADLNEAVTASNVTTETADRIWALCDRGQKWSNDGSTGSRPILNPNTPIFPADLTPAVSWWFLLRNIVTEAGFELVASSLENILNDYWMPFCNTPQLQNEGGSNQYFFAAYPDAPFLVDNDFMNPDSSYTNMVELFDNNGDFDAVTGIYTASAVGTFTFRVRQFFSTATGVAGTNYIIIKLNVYINDSLDSTYWGYFFSNQGALVPQTGLFDQTFNLSLEIGDTVLFEYESFQAIAIGSLVNGNFSWTPVDLFENGTADVYGLAGDGTTNTSYIEINSANITVGQTISYSLNAPDMRQIDFVNDVIKMHNCAIIPSRIVPNQIGIIPQNNYLGTGDVVDWTGKLDVSKDVMTSSTVDIQKATFQFTYTSGEDAYSRLYVNANRVYGDFKAEGYTINPSTPPSDFAIGDQKIQLTTRSAPAAFIPGTGAPIQCFYNDQLEFVAPGPRALFNAGGITVSLYNEATSNAVEVVVPILNHYSAAYPNVDDYDLNWAPEIPPHVVTVSANPYNNLFNSYWRNYMNELYSPEGRIMEAFFALDLKDILTFSFADKVWIQDSYWRILEISDYKVGLQESTKVKLIKFLDQINDCSSTPVSVTANGEVEFESGGEAVEPNEDCCSRYGYFWDEINGVCWAFNNGGQFRNSIVSNQTLQTNNPALEALSNAPLSIANGTKLSIVPGNSAVLMVGQDLSLTKNVRRSNLLGTNATTNLPGLHVGGGYRDGNSTSPYYGWAQFGTFVLQRYPTINVSGQTEDLYIEGIAGEYINMPDNTLWSCFWNVTIKDNTGASETSLHHFTLEKIGNIASASAINTLSTIGLVGSNVFTFGIDTTTNTDEHRINVTFTGGSYIDQFFITSSLQYQQSKTT